MSGQAVRACGPCSLCCKALSVGAIPKGRGVWCQHASREGGGCRIYDERPGACRSYACAWLQGHPAFEDGDRPDLTGVVATAIRSEVALLEEREGALRSGRLPALRRRLLASGATVVCLPRRGGRYQDFATS